MLPNLGSAAHCLKANTQETNIGWKGKIALFRRLAEKGSLGRRQTHVQNLTPKTLLCHEGFCRENHLERESESSSS